VAGDMAECRDENGQPLPGVALVAMQQGVYFAETIKHQLKGAARKPFHYHDLGKMATIGRNRAISEYGRLRLAGRLGWWFWLLVHIYRLSGFRNRLSVLIQWAWSYWTFSRGARLIVDREWRAYGQENRIADHR
jgi:NADH dehydrogenase